jgi:amidase
MKRRHVLKLLAASNLFPFFSNVNAMPNSESIHLANLVRVRDMFKSGTLTPSQLLDAYLVEIARIDRRGPNLHAILELNPAARDIAQKFASARPEDARPLLGIPVLIKGNIATGDAMQTSAGSFALDGGPALRDAHLVTRLREAGAVLMGKTNLSEWANLRCSRSISGWSAVGGLTRNPHVLDRTASGSSSGSAVAVAAGLCALAVGTETDGSIVSPASCNGIVGIKPTVGLVSRDGIIPISHTQDTAGPMARTVTDAALLLSVLAGRDARDDTTALAPSLAMLSELSPDALRGRRIGIVRSAFSKSPEVIALTERAIALMQGLGAVVVDPVELPSGDKYNESELLVLLTEFKVGLANYLGEFARPGQPRSLADVIAFNLAHADRELSEFGQDLFETAEATKGLADPAYLAALVQCRDLARTNGIELALSQNGLDALCAPTGDPAYPIDLVNGDSGGASFSTPAAVAGLPHITVPMGAVRGLPVGLSLVGAAYSEPRLIGMAYAYEQASNARVMPSFIPTVPLKSKG